MNRVIILKANNGFIVNVDGICRPPMSMLTQQPFYQKLEGLIDKVSKQHGDPVLDKIMDEQAQEKEPEVKVSPGGYVFKNFGDMVSFLDDYLKKVDISDVDAGPVYGIGA